VAPIFLIMLMPGIIEDASMPVMMLLIMGPTLVCPVLIFLWWMFFSRGLWKEKLLGAAAIVVVGLATYFLVHQSLHGFTFMMSVIPVSLAAFATALILTHRMRPVWRTGFAILVLIVACGYWTLVRQDGVWGDFHSSRSWRWQPTAEEIFLVDHVASRKGQNNDMAELPLGTPEWPGFRGPHRDAIVRGVKLSTDWQLHPPKQLWQTKVGPGWSSFAVAGRRLFTMEQRGENEAIICLDADTGHQMWAYQYPSRFWESMGGAGPRATPALADGALFALGGDGLLHRLDPITGEMIWSRDLKVDGNREPPTWGFSSSPLVVGKLVIVYAGGDNDKGVLAYDVQSGELKWSAPAGNHSYSSPELLTLGDQEYVAMVTNRGLSLINPADGSVVLEYPCASMEYRTLQPLVFDSTSVLLGTGMGDGTHRIDFSGSGDKLKGQEVWNSLEMESDFNDFVAHQGNLYGFDRNIFACVDLTTGQRQWKKGRYGNGQVLLLPDANQLLVTTETGEVVLLNASPEAQDELARIKVFDSKTWNHSAVVGNRMYLRNAEEAACLELPMAESETLRETSTMQN
jgi:outer membrane protein assembly factor BamB